MATVIERLEASKREDGHYPADLWLDAELFERLHREMEYRDFMGRPLLPEPEVPMIYVRGVRIHRRAAVGPDLSPTED